MKAIGVPIDSTVEQLREAIALALPFPASREFLDASQGVSFTVMVALGRQYGIAAVPTLPQPTRQNRRIPPAPVTPSTGEVLLALIAIAALLGITPGL
jgi:hypothetical protein